MGPSHSLAALLLAVLAAAVSARPRSPARPATKAAPCRHPYGLKANGRLRVACLAGPTASSAELLAVLRQPARSGPELRVGEMLVLDGALSRRDALPAAVRLNLGLPLDINRAGAADLEQLPGVGPVMARRILAERERRGGFRRPEELRGVRGVGPTTWRRLRPWVCVEGPQPARCP